MDVVSATLYLNRPKQPRKRGAFFVRPLELKELFPSAKRRM